MLAKVAIASTMPDGYWTLGTKWTQQAQTLELHDKPIEASAGEDAVKAFHERAALIAKGKITVEDIARAKQDARLVVVEIEVPAQAARK